jgi:hypothetical protein
MIVFGIIYYLNKKKQNQTPTQTPPTTPVEAKKDLSNINAQDYSEILSKNFQIATAKSLEWKQNAQFVFLKVQIPEDLNPLKVTETYVYNSNDSPLMFWTIGFNLKSDFIRALIYKNDFLQGESIKKISTQYWQVDWITAFQKADKSGGKDFRDKIKDGLEITADLKYESTKGYLYWFITYQALNSDDQKVIQIDANTGEIIQPETTPSPQT